ncbi:helix-turn-helix domain-containing protein [Clostridium sp. AF22-10]|uniref:helix-turn-helix domain-containing protein n=1 Tax=Clostridium sp. AF22-10 TaxID=2293004 RepID=UPI001FA9B58E
MNERVKAVRKHENVNLSQEAFGNRIGLTKAAISKIEKGVSKMSEQTILSICREFNVNEEWLRTGSGDMFSQCPKTKN